MALSSKIGPRQLGAPSPHYQVLIGGATLMLCLPSTPSIFREQLPLWYNSFSSLFNNVLFRERPVIVSAPWSH